MNNFFVWLNDNKNICIPIAVSIISIIVTWIIRSRIQCRKSKKIQQQIIANNIFPMRQAWINDLRDSLVDFISQAQNLRMHIIDTVGGYALLNTDSKTIAEYTGKLKIVATKIDLLLPFQNKQKKEEKAEELRTEVEKLLPLFNVLDNNQTENKTIVEKINLISEKYVPTIQRLAKEVLKEEWEATKNFKP